MKVTILDMQPIEPAIGGGRLRLLGLYHGLGNGIEATYVGTYDWRGPRYRRHKLSACLEEIDIPLTEEHFQAADAARERAGGRGVIDCVFHYQAHLSPDYVAQARMSALNADVVVFSHPWIYPLVTDVLDPSRQLIIYDSHNVEGVLRTQMLDDGADGTEVAYGVVEVENQLCQAADLLLACSQADRAQFSRIYEIPIERIKVIPNGVFTQQITPANQSRRQAARGRLGLDENGALAIFLGSNYGPNVEAALFIAQVLAPQSPEVNFVVAGGVGQELVSKLGSNVPCNVRTPGILDDKTKLEYLAAADIAVNPMLSGSGTNIKMFDFMAAALPIVTTAVGARGIETSREAFIVSDRNEFAVAVKSILADEERRKALSTAARNESERNYSWERISENLGVLLSHHQRGKCAGGAPPKISVIVPTFDRSELLTRLIDLLAVQTNRDFEVIVVDQSEAPWSGVDLNFDLDLLYVRSKTRGAVTARNLGATLSRGEVLAFIDDDCEPPANWLAEALRLFGDPGVVGIEGLIESSRRGDPAWRAVTNKGFAGMGFMTANLFVRAGAFNQLNGFDICFENPHFREDTDFGWRLQDLGRVPFSTEVWVFHPPHRRNIERESQANRATFFENDALLLRKHPERYRELFLAEAHWKHTSGFWPSFLAGAAKHNVELPEYVRTRCPTKI